MLRRHALSDIMHAASRVDATALHDVLAYWQRCRAPMFMVQAAGGVTEGLCGVGNSVCRASSTPWSENTSGHDATSTAQQQKQQKQQTQHVPCKHPQLTQSPHPLRPVIQPADASHWLARMSDMQHAVQTLQHHAMHSGVDHVRVWEGQCWALGVDGEVIKGCVGVLERRAEESRKMLYAALTGVCVWVGGDVAVCVYGWGGCCVYTPKTCFHRL